MKKLSLVKHPWMLVLAMLFLAPAGAFAAGPPLVSELSKPMAQVLVVIIVVLALIIILLANVVSGAATMFIQKHRNEKKSGNDRGSVFLTFALLLLSSSVFAQSAPAVEQVAAPSSTTIGGLGFTAFYALISVIVLELIIMLALLYNLRVLLSKEAILSKDSIKEKPSFSWSAWWDKVNSFRPQHEESNIDLGHNYDGIRELDNRLPPWWLYGFYLCIVFAGIYLYRYHVSHSAPLSKEELAISIAAGEAETEAYLKTAANKVDENTVVLLTDANALAEGKKIFATACVACHLADGGGSVGPNLTDAYWLHGGGIKDIFKTLKYGWPEKGMKSWKDDYSPVQLAQIASYVKTLVGTSPAKPKEPQGVLFDEKATGIDSTAKPAGDTVKAGLGTQ